MQSGDAKGLERKEKESKDPTPRYQRFIEPLIADFINNLPTEKIAFENTVKDFQAMFAGQLNRNHPFHGLQLSFHEPQMYLHGIQSDNDNLKVSDIQKFIADSIIKAVIETSKKMSPPYKDQMIFKFKVDNQPFKQDKMPVETGEHPYCIVPENRNFKGRLIPVAQFHIVLLEIVCREEFEELKLPSTRDKFVVFMAEYGIKLPKEPEKGVSFRDEFISCLTKIGILQLADFPPGNFTDEEFDTFMDQLIVKESTLLTMENAAIPRIIKQAAEYVSEEKLKQLNPWAKKLLTYEVIYNLVITQQLPVEDLNVSSDQFELVTSSDMLNLIHDRQSFAATLEVSKAELRILSHHFYPVEFDEGRMDFARDFKGLSLEESFNLTMTAVVHLMKENKITIDQAKKLSELDRKLLANVRYFNLLRTGQVNILSLLKLKIKIKSRSFK